MSRHSQFDRVGEEEGEEDGRYANRIDSNFGNRLNAKVILGRCVSRFLFASACLGLGDVQYTFKK